MVNAVQIAPTRAAQIRNPFAPPAVDRHDAPAPPSDDVQLTPPPARPAASSPSRSFWTAAGLALAVASSVLVPTMASAATLPPAVSQSLTISSKAASQSDPATILKGVADSARQAAQALPQSNQTHAQWAASLASLKATAHDLNSQVDHLMRNAKDNPSGRQAAINKDLTTLTQQLTAATQQIQQSQSTLDTALGSSRDTLNAAGTTALSGDTSTEKLELQAPLFSAQQSELRTLHGQFHRASIDLADATEKTTESRAVDKTLGNDMKALSQILAQLQKASDGAKKDPSTLSNVDTAGRVFEAAVSKVSAAVKLSQQDVQEAASRAQAAASTVDHLTQSLAPAATEAASQQH